MKDNILVRLSSATRALSLVSTAIEAKKIADMAKAAELFATKQKSEEAKHFAHGIYIDALRLEGAFLKQGSKHRGGRPRKTGARREPVSKTLEELGISKKESKLAQEVHSISEEKPEYFSEVRKGEMSLIEARRRRQQDRRDEKRQAALSEEVHSGIVVGDFRKKSNQVKDGSVSLIFTDPPYDRKSEELFPGLADFSAAKLAEGGSLIFYVGHLQLPAAFEAFKDKLRHWWTCACFHGGDKALMREYGIRVGWKPMLWFVKGTRDQKDKVVFDIVTGSKDKTFHDWQQHEDDAAYYIENLCPEDGLVCDPFLGGGTTAATAQRLKRKWIGFEIDPKTAALASRRLSP